MHRLGEVAQRVVLALDVEAEEMRPCGERRRRTPYIDRRVVVLFGKIEPTGILVAIGALKQRNDAEIANDPVLVEKAPRVVEPGLRNGEERTRVRDRLREFALETIFARAIVEREALGRIYLDRLAVELERLVALPEVKQQRADRPEHARILRIERVSLLDPPLVIVRAPQAQIDIRP